MVASCPRSCLPLRRSRLLVCPYFSIHAFLTCATSCHALHAHRQQALLLLDLLLTSSQAVTCILATAFWRSFAAHKLHAAWAEQVADDCRVRFSSTQ